eukprot:3281614-Amphidinium_carterae.1
MVAVTTSVRQSPWNGGGKIIAMVTTAHAPNLLPTASAPRAGVGWWEADLSRVQLLERKRTADT